MMGSPILGSHVGTRTQGGRHLTLDNGFPFCYKLYMHMHMYTMYMHMYMHMYMTCTAVDRVTLPQSPQ